MIPEPGDTNREVHVNEIFHVQIDDELTENELKQIEADDQAIQTILLGLPEDITDPTTAMNMALYLMAKAFKLNYSTPTNNNQRIHQTHVIGRLLNRNVGNLNGYNAVQKVRNQVAQNAIQNPRIQNVGNQNGQTVVPGTNQNLNVNGNLVAARAEGNASGHNRNQIRCYNCRGVGHFARNCTVRPRRKDVAYLQTQLLIAQKEETGIQLQAEEFDLMAAAADLDEIEEVNANCILIANLQQASTSEEQYTELLEPIPESHQVPHNNNNVISEVTSVEQSGGTVEQHPANVEETRALYDSLYQNLAIEVEKVNTEIERLLRAVVSQDIMSVVQNNSVGETSHLQTELERFDSKGQPRGTSTNTKFAKQSILGKPPKIGETHALSKPVTSNSISTPQESKVVKKDKVIVPGIFRINPFKTSREEKHVPNKVRASDRIKPINVLQPSVITKKDVNYDSNGLSSTGIANTKTRRPRPRSNTKNDRFMGTVRFGNDHVAAILGFGDLQWGNILITRVYFVEGLGHNLFSVGQFCDSDLEVAFRRNTCFVRNLEGVDLLNGNRTTNLYTINLYDMASASLICLMARASSTKSWLRHQCLSHLNFDTINDLAKNDLVSGLSKFKYHKEHLCPSCEQGKSKRASHPPKPVPNSRQRLHLLHIDLCGQMRIASINGKRFVLVIADDYSCYTWVQFLRSKDEAPKVIKTFLKRITILLQSPVIIIKIDNVKAARTMLIFSRAPLFLWAEAIATACFTQNRSIIHRRFNKTPYELINGRKPDISFLHVFGALYYPKNDREDIRKLGAKGDIGFFIGYSADSCAYRVYNRRTKKIMETINVSFDELSSMAFEQRSSKPGLQSMTFGQISSRLDLTYAPSTITTQKPSEGELDLLFEAMYDDYICGQPSVDSRSVPAAQAHQICQSSTTSSPIANTAPTPINSSSQAKNFPSTSQDVDGLRTQQQHAQQQGNQASL
nr:retrovirus-related Pol polyprotein from transposon TNT 1-94 [Tanacetum cinerariifolium]